MSRRGGMAWSRRLLLLGLLAANGWAQHVLWFGNQGLIRWRQTEKELVLIHGRVHEVEQRIQRLKREIVLLDKEQVVLEEVARRELGLVYPDETIFVFPPGR